MATDKSLDTYLLAFQGAAVDYPFGAGVRVYKVSGKMFALLSEKAEPQQLNLKCHPDEAQALRDVFPSVIPGYHMNKRHWNTVLLDGSVPQGEIERMIESSYALVVKGLTKVQRAALEATQG